MKRFHLVGPVLACLACGLMPADALARTTDKPTKTTAKTASKAPDPATDKSGGKLIETYGDWTASLAQGKAKTCYALAKPKQRIPEGKHDQAYVFIADRPAEKVRNEVSIIMGFPIKEGMAAKAKVGKTEFDLAAVSNAFFMKNPSDDDRFVDVLKHGGALIVKAPAPKGPPTTDVYALTGFKQALDRVQKECR